MKGAAIPEAFFLLAFLSLSFSRVTCAFPFIYKMGSRMPHERRKGLNELNEAQLRSSFSPKTWDMLPLSSVCNPYYKLVLGTRAAADWT